MYKVSQQIPLCENYFPKLPPNDVFAFKDEIVVNFFNSQQDKLISICQLPFTHLNPTENLPGCS